MPPEVYSVLMMFFVTFAVLIPLTWCFEKAMGGGREGGGE